jgi:imidazolonepropionase-like amidohydrolase
MRAVLSAALLFVASFSPVSAQVTLYEGARLITGEGGTIEDSAFLVDGGRFAQVGRRGEIALPSGAERIDLAGKTVMPALIDTHIHLGYRKGLTFTPDNYTRETIADTLDRLAYYGIGAFLETGTAIGTLAYEMRSESGPRPHYLTAGRGLAMPNAGALGPMRGSGYGVTSEEEARADVRELAGRKVDMVKIWVDDRGGAVAKLRPDLYRAIIEEAHKHNMRVLAHVPRLEDAKDLLRAGIDGLAHMARLGEVDEEFLALLKERPHVFLQHILWGEQLLFYNAKPAWAEDAILRDTLSGEEIRLLGNVFAERGKPDAAAEAAASIRNIAKLKAIGARMVVGTDTGGVNGGQYFGLGTHVELEMFVTMGGMTPMEAILAGTRDAALVLRLDGLGSIAPGKEAAFVVLSANPLENIANTRRIESVYLYGKELPRSALRARWQEGNQKPN